MFRRIAKIVVVGVISILGYGMYARFPATRYFKVDVAKSRERNRFYIDKTDGILEIIPFLEDRDGDK
jgi:hypothetical protein